MAPRPHSAEPGMRDVAEGTPVDEAIAALRARGADLADPVRFRVIEALAQRAHTQTGATRQRLDLRLGELLVDYDARCAALVPAPERGPAAAPSPGPLGELAQLLSARHRAAPTTPPGTPPGAPSRSAGAATPGRDLQALDYFRNTWSKLAVQRSLNQSIAKTPKNAGPLNSHRLVLRSLQVMREVSPAYVNRFVSYVDALMALERLGDVVAGVPPPAGGASAAGAAASAPAPAEREKKRRTARK